MTEQPPRPQHDSRLADAVTQRTATSFGAWVDLAPDVEYWGDIQFLGALDLDDDHVLRAWDPAVMRQIGVKLMPGGSPPPREVVDFLDHTRALAKVSHPAFVTIHGIEKHDDVTGLRLELVEGAHLEGLVRRGGPLPLGEVSRVSSQIGGALSAIHEADRAHGSVTPRHVRCRPNGSFVLMEPSLVVGPQLVRPPAHPGFLPPETLAGRAATVATDVYSLGSLLFHLLTGERPVPGETAEELRAALDSGALPDVLALRPDVPVELAAAVSRALAPQPRDRWSAVTDLLAAAGVDEVW